MKKRLYLATLTLIFSSLSSAAYGKTIKNSHTKSRSLRLTSTGRQGQEDADNLQDISSVRPSLPESSDELEQLSSASSMQIPYIVGASAFPQRYHPSIATRVRHSFQLQIPNSSRALLHLTIDVPSGLKIGKSKNIKVFTHSGHKIPAIISEKESQILVTFFAPVPPGTKLNVELNNIRVSGVSNAWLYSVSAKMVGMSRDIPVDIVRFPIY